MSENPITPDDDDLEDDFEEDPTRWLCQKPECRQPVEANPTLYLSLMRDGSWEISGVADEAAMVVCTEGHDQDDQELDKSLTAFLEQEMPGTTWQGANPRTGAGLYRYEVSVGHGEETTTVEAVDFNLEQAVTKVIKDGLRSLTFDPTRTPLTITATLGEPLD